MPAGFSVLLVSLADIDMYVYIATCTHILLVELLEYITLVSISHDLYNILPRVACMFSHIEKC